jgi:hypothetical protein
MSAARFKAKDSRIGTAMAQIRPSAALYFATNDTYVGFENDPSAAILISDIIMQGGEKPSDGGGGVEIAEKVDAYCVEVKMNGPFYWCVDSTGVSKQYESNPACDAIADRYTCD